jgi:hypothetical protein
MYTESWSYHVPLIQAYELYDALAGVHTFVHLSLLLLYYWNQKKYIGRRWLSQRINDFIAYLSQLSGVDKIILLAESKLNEFSCRLSER